MLRVQRIKIAAVTVSFSAADTVITLCSQSHEYWHDHSQADEGNVLFAHLLHTGPGYFLGGAVLWDSALVALILFLPRRASLMTAVAFTLAHGYAVIGWLENQYEISMWLRDPVCFPILAAAVIYQVLKAAEPNQTPDPTAPSGRGFLRR
jgi:hypothetical protein